MGLWALAGAAQGAQDALAQLMAQQEAQRLQALEESSVRQRMQDTKEERAERKRQADLDEQYRRDALKQSGEAITSQRALSQETARSNDLYRQSEAERRESERQRQERNRQEDNKRGDAMLRLAQISANRKDDPRVIRSYGDTVMRDGKPVRVSITKFSDGTTRIDDVGDQFVPSLYAKEKDLQAASGMLGQLERLSKKINRQQGALQKLKGTVDYAAAKANLDDDVAVYKNLREGMLSLVARDVFQRKGVLTEQDEQRSGAPIPDLFASDTLADAQFREMRNILDNTASSYGFTIPRGRDAGAASMGDAAPEAKTIPLANIRKRATELGMPLDKAIKDAEAKGYVIR